MAPEIMGRYSSYGPEVDYWAATVVLFSLATCRLPFSQDDNNSYTHSPQYAMISGCTNNSFGINTSSRPALNYIEKFWTSHNLPMTLSEEFKDFIALMFSDSPSLRMTLTDMLSHPWMKGEVASQEECQDEFTNRR